MRNTTKYASTAQIIVAIDTAADVYRVDLDGCATVREVRAAFARDGMDCEVTPGSGANDPTIADWLDELDERGVCVAVAGYSKGEWEYVDT